MIYKEITLYENDPDKLTDENIIKDKNNISLSLDNTKSKLKLVPQSTKNPNIKGKFKQSIPFNVKSHVKAAYSSYSLDNGFKMINIDEVSKFQIQNFQESRYAINDIGLVKAYAANSHQGTVR